MNGSAFGEEIDCMILNICLLSATSVLRSLPSLAGSFNCPIISDSSTPSDFNLVFKSDQYFLGVLLSLKTPTTSITEK